jgi:hypothetical protein
MTRAGQPADEIRQMPDVAPDAAAVRVRWD